MPPVARMMASAAKALSSIVRRFEGDDAARRTLRVDHGGEELPPLVLVHLALGLVAAHLLVECVEQLLARRGAGKRRAMVERAAETAEVEQPLGCAVEGHAHAIEQIDDPRRRLAHGLHRRLVGQEVAAVDRVVEVLRGGVALALQVLRGVDAALGADRVRPLDRHNGEQIHRAAGLGDLDDRCQPGQPSANHDDSGCCHSFL